MKRVLILFLIVFLIACQPTTTPPPTNQGPATENPGTDTPPTINPPPAETITALPPTETPTATPTPTEVTSFPNPDAYTWETFVSGLTRPVDLQHAGDGSGRLFVIEKVGRIRVVQDGQLLETPFMDIVERVGSDGNEQGLLGMAFHPNYPENGFFYVNYTDVNGDTVIARFQVTADANLADPNSQVVMVTVDQPFRNHNGGVLAFGPDGYLYAGLGDGGSAGDPNGNAQALDTLLGKILRLDVDSAAPYAIPPDNPFGNEIWAYGLRNPWRFSFDKAKGDLFIGDVGQGNWEEIDHLPAGTPGGTNFGWDYFEGTHPFEGTPPQEAQLVPPVAEYNHGDGCSVTGGYVYRGSVPEWNGIYLYGDYCSGIVWGLIQSGGGWQNQVLFSAPGRITSFGQDESGEIYLITDDGQVLRLTPL